MTGFVKTGNLAPGQVGTTAGTLAAGDDSRFTNALSALRTIGYSLNDTSLGGGAPSGSDDTTIFNNVWAHCVADQVPLIIPSGADWHLNGSLDPGAWQYPSIIGAGFESSTVILGSGVTMVTPSLHQNGCLFADFTCQGGKGFYHNTYTLPQVLAKFLFHRIRFVGYTGCAIANESPDNPYLDVENCEFRGNDFLATMGIAWSGGSDQFRIVGNIFCINRIGVKLGHRPDDANMRGPKNGMIANNDFLRLARGATDPSVHNLWIVPGSSVSGGLSGTMAINSNKWGSENLRDATTNGANGIANSDGQSDRWILIADEDAIGSDNTTRFPVFTSSVNNVNGISFDESNMLNGNGTSAAPIPTGIIYSTTTYVTGCRIAATSRGIIPTWALELKDDPAPSASVTAGAAARYNSTNIFGPFRSLVAGVSASGTLGSNYPGMGRMIDPVGLSAGELSQRHNDSGGMNLASYKDLLTTRINSATLGGSATSGAITDSQGGADAIEVTYPSNGFLRFTLGSFTPGIPVYIDFDCMQGQTGSPLALIDVQVLIPAGVMHFRRAVTRLPTAWESRRFSFTPREAGPYTLQFISTGLAGTARFGRVQVYHAQEPVSHGPYVFRSPNGTIYKAGVDDTGVMTGIIPNPASDIIIGAKGTGNVASTAWPANFECIFVRLWGTGTISNLLFNPTVLSGNYLVGLYANSGAGRNAVPTGAAILSTTSAAMSGLTANGLATIALGGSQAIIPGSHWGMLAIDTTGASVARETVLNTVMSAGYARSQVPGSLQAPTASGTVTTTYWPWMQAS